MRSLNIAATGAQAQTSSIDNIANNIANANTTSFKKGFLATTDLHYQSVRRAGGAVDANADVVVPTSLQYGAGAAVSAIIRDPKQGEAVNTNRPLDTSIVGNGYFVLNMPDGTQAYTRDGSFHVDPVTNQLVTSLGYVVGPGIEIPIDHKSIMIKENGQVLAALPNEDEPQIVGDLDIVIFANPNGLELQGNNILLQTDASGEAQLGIAGEDNYGTVKQGWLEGSNVSPIIEMTDLVKAQRGYEMDVKVIATSDQMMEKVTNV